MSIANCPLSVWKIKEIKDILCVCVCVCMYVYIFIFIYIYICMYVCIFAFREQKFSQVILMAKGM